MEIVVATRNNDKLKEIKALVKDLGLKVSSLEDYPDVPEIKETGETFRENALLKATAVSEFTGKLTLADDSGLEVKALNGRPGVYSSRFAGEKVSYKDNNLKLLKLLEKIPLGRRKARFVCSVAIVKPGEKSFVVEESCRGVIGFSPKGISGFGYDPLFIPEGYKKSFAELGPRLKNRLSHRARALKGAKAVILTHFLQNP